MLHRDVTESIIGVAMDVVNELRPGLDEKVYENALVVGLQEKGHVVSQQERFPIHYRDQLVGTLIPDVIVDDVVVVEAKVAESITDSHVSQALGYLAITAIPIALVRNFKYRDLRWKRLVASEQHTRSPSPE